MPTTKRDPTVTEKPANNRQAMTQQQIANLQNLSIDELGALHRITFTALGHARNGNKKRYTECITEIESVIGKLERDVNQAMYRQLYRAYFRKLINSKVTP